MRILFAAHHSSRVAGTETYVATAIAALTARGHSVGLLAELPPSPSRQPIVGASESWCVHPEGEAEALRRAREWRPDIVYVQGLRSLDLERALVATAPAVLFAHSYVGLCISGSRTWQASGVPCTRSFGPGCLLKYFPCRCGGKSPVTMWRDYRQQRGRQDLHEAYRAIVVASWHMASMFSPSGMTHRVHVLPIPVQAPPITAPRELTTPLRMVYAGRLERLKGVQMLIEAAALARARLGVATELRIAGDGPLRSSVESEARRCGEPLLQVHLDGWRNDSERDLMFASAHLLLMPSVWPEPFGLAGLEAARFGVPAAAFASGGIPEWLRDGVNGTLANERSASGLADAIVRCVEDPGRYSELSNGALTAARATSPQVHAAALDRVFSGALR